MSQRAEVAAKWVGLALSVVLVLFTVAKGYAALESQAEYTDREVQRLDVRISRSLDDVKDIERSKVDVDRFDDMLKRIDTIDSKIDRLLSRRRR